MEGIGLSRNIFNEWFDSYYKELIRYLYSFVNDHEVARDLVHDLFLTLWERQYTPDPNRPIRNYLFTIARNQAFNYLKHQRIVALKEQQIIEEHLFRESDSNDIEERFKRVRIKLKQLPEKQHEVVIKCCMEGKLYREAAAEMGISENTVKTHLMRAMKFLREELKDSVVLWLFLQKKYFSCHLY